MNELPVPTGHVCTDACTHEGSSRAVRASAEKKAAAAAPASAKTGNENVVMGSPEVGLGGRPVPKDAIHKNR